MEPGAASPIVALSQALAASGGYCPGRRLRSRCGPEHCVVSYRPDAPTLEALGRYTQRPTLLLEHVDALLGTALSPDPCGQGRRLLEDGTLEARYFMVQDDSSCVLLQATDGDVVISQVLEDCRALRSDEDPE